ncbi:hypothetical protein KP509_36G038700 [Ceratopteris richardii]|nr:hypothetical protein KP509_36G038700 [Ceratopteris richardii]
MAASLEKECRPHSEKALDTTDLSFWMYTVVPNCKAKEEQETYSDADSEELERRAANEKVAEKVIISDEQEDVDEHTKREEFRARVKESLALIRMRTEMLQDLSMGDASNAGNATIAEGDTAFMSSSSILMKHARKLAGLLHTEEQAIRFQDLYQWLQNIGKILGDDALGASPRSALQNQLEKFRSLNEASDHLKTPQDAKPLHTPSPHEILKQVECDLRDRLANLYQGKMFMMSHQADTWTSSGVGKEGTLQKTIERVQNMEIAYEMLGSTILQSLKEVDKMEEDFRLLQAELVTNGCPLMTIAHKKGKSHKGKKKGTSSGSSPSESSSALSSSRPEATQADESIAALSGSEQPPDRTPDEKSPVSDRKSGNKKSKTKTPRNKNKRAEEDTEKKTVSPTEQGSQKQTFSSTSSLPKKVEENNNSQNSGNEKRSSLTPNESGPGQSSSSSGPTTIPEASHRTMASSEGLDEGQKGTLTENILPTTSAANDPVQVKEALVDGSASRRDSIDGKAIVSNPSQSSKKEGDLIGTENRPVIPKVSLNVLDKRPSDSASAQILPKPKRKSRRFSTEASKDEAIQTDDVAILSLEDCDVDALQSREYQAIDVKELLERLKKMQKQLQFWRTKNWAEKHTGKGHTIPPPLHSQFVTVDASPDMGMLSYYNSRTGIHVTKNFSELDANTQEYIMHLVEGSNLSL